jgi:hypothetical protein
MVLTFSSSGGFSGIVNNPHIELFNLLTSIFFAVLAYPMSIFAIYEITKNKKKQTT